MFHDGMADEGNLQRRCRRLKFSVMGFVLEAESDGARLDSFGENL